jgi:hypothetical protein
MSANRITGNATATFAAMLMVASLATAADVPAKATVLPTTTAHKASSFKGVKMTQRAMLYYMAAWGIDKLNVSSTASGNLIRFTYRVADPALAKPLGDEKAIPYLYSQRSHAMLQVPTMDKVGNLRQVGAQKAGMEYWMVFSNKGNLVKQGDRVNVIIGNFHADGLLVE